MSKRVAILVANQDFHPDSNLNSLRGPLNDAAALTNTLGSDEIGNFTVKSFVNSTSYEVKSAIDEQLSASGIGDFILIYYSGHGKLDRYGNLCLAMSDTRSAALQTTSIPIHHLKEFVSQSYCQCVVLILDCCYSGLATGQTRGDIESQLQSLDQASGFFVLSASSDVQVATEEEKNGSMFGRFTSLFVEGLLSGSADFDGDGFVSLGEIHQYIKLKLRGQSPWISSAKASTYPLIGRVPKPKDRGQGLDSKNSQNNSDDPPHSIDSIQYQRKFRLRVKRKIAHPHQVVDIAFSRDDSSIATVCDDGIVRIFDTSLYELLGKLKSQPNILRSASWSRGGREIATSDSQGRIVLWRDGFPVNTIKSGSKSLWSAQYSPDGMRLVAGSEDGVVSLWHPQRGQAIWSEKHHDGVIGSVRFSNDGKLIVTSSYDGQAIVINAKNGQEITRFVRKSEQITSAAFVSNTIDSADSCVSASLSGEVCMWSATDGSKSFIATKHNFWVRALDFCSQSMVAISGGYDAKITLMDLLTNNVFEAVEVDQGPIVCIRASYSEDTIAISTHDGMVYIVSIDYH